MKINQENIKTVIINIPVKIKQITKTIYGLPHSGKYLLLSLLFFILFMIITFPFDFLIKKKIYSFEGKLFRSIDISGFDFSIFGETYLDNFLIVLNNSNEISCKNSILNIALNPLTLLIQNKVKSDFQFDSLKYSAKDFEFIFNINGNMELSLDKQSNTPKNGPIKIILSDSIIKLNKINIPGPMGPLPLKIESINIQSGNIDSQITDGVLRFNTFKLTGSDITCDLTGTIELSNITSNSKMDLSVNIDSESAVLDQYKDILGTFIKNNLLSLRIKGTLAKPEFKLNNTEKNEN
jgi:hypothetical protein